MIARFPFLAPKNAAGDAGQVNLACFSAMSSAPYGVASDAHVLVTLVPVRSFISCFWGNVMGLSRDMKYLLIKKKLQYKEKIIMFIVSVASYP